MSNTFVILILQLEEERNWQRAAFYDSLGTKPLSAH